MKRKLLLISALCVLTTMHFNAQTGNVGINTITPGTTLDVNGAITNRETAVAVATNAATIPANISLARLTGAATAAVAITAPTAPNAGQRLIIYNNTTGGFAASLNSFTIPNGQALEFTYSNGGWRATNGGADTAGTNWNILGNTGTSPATNFLGTIDNQDMVFRTNNIEKARIAAGGNVGIGTTAPVATTHIINKGTGGSFVDASSNLGNMGLRLENTTNGNAVIQHFVTKNSGGATRQFVLGVNPQGSGGGGVFVMSRDTASDFLVDLSNGNIGAGVFPSTNTKFDVGTPSGTTEFPIIRVSNTSTLATGNKAIIGFNAYNGGGATWGMGTEQLSTNVFDSNFHIYYSGGGTYVKNFTVAPDIVGSSASRLRLGINTASPQNFLDLGPFVGSSITDAVGKKFAIYNSAAGTDFYGLGVSANALQFHASSTPTEAPQMVLSGNGYLGIGITSPTSPIHVDSPNSIVQNLQTSATSLAGGVIQLRKSTAAVSGDNWVNFIANGATVGFISSNSATTVAYNTTSDERLKENIKNTHLGIGDVMKISVKDYNYKADAGKTPQTGFIAQQLYEVFPGAVTKGGADASKNPWAVDYGKVTPILTKAIQDQQKEIETLKSEVKELTQLIKEMQKMITTKMPDGGAMESTSDHK
ncbi:tail fiber domain-containing protein [Chryseobacterium sp. G0201]|uniref:tail fiber domain-containing protein n=1 Tax=Chryseobacterium sp. G0201 TaxID=2487065 RepID=UPI0013DE4B09|nr:tail fiber domain-containing protein [Chryseobacterium sp. G0201]